MRTIRAVKERLSLTCVVALLFVWALAANTLRAQPLSGRDRWADSARQLIDLGTERGDSTMLSAAQILLDRALTAFPTDPLLLHYRGYVLYRQGLAQGREPAKRARALAIFQSAEEALELSGSKLNLAETFELQAAVLGNLITLNEDPASVGAALGERSGVAAARATQLGPHNPRVWLLRGIGALYTPPAFGGGVELAERCVSDAVKMFETDNPAPPLPRWGRADAQLWLGQIYLREGKREAARAAFQRATTMEPENRWAKQLLASVGDGDRK